MTLEEAEAAFEAARKEMLDADLALTILIEEVARAALRASPAIAVARSRVSLANKALAQAAGRKLEAADKAEREKNGDDMPL